MSSRHAIAVDLGRRRLRALYGVADDGVLDVRRSVVADVPDHVDRDDAEAIGRWVGTRLREAGILAGRATIALAREHVSVKRLTLPSIEPDELPDMVRLALRRELTFDPDHAAIDFMTIEQTDSSTTVIAVAAPDTVLDFQRQVFKAAGLGVHRISLRSQGTSTLIGREPRTNGECALAIDITGDGVEFSVTLDGSVLFTRATELPEMDGAAAVAEAVITETRRTWMSYRITQESQDVSSAVVLGPRDVVCELLGPVQRMLNVEARPLDTHPMVEAPEGSLDALWPLAGLLLEPMIGAETFDFAHPRRAPDRAAHRRQRVIVAAGLILVAIMAAWTVGRTQLQRLEDRLVDVRGERSRLGPRYMRVERDGYRLDHLERWETVQVDWLEHAAFLLQVAPPPDHLVLDSWTGSLSFRGVQYDRREEASSRWSAPREITIVLDGEAVDRPTADALREALVEGNLYVTSSSGTDSPGGRRLPFGFTYRLRTEHSVPDPEGGPPVGMAAGRDGS